MEEKMAQINAPITDPFRSVAEVTKAREIDLRTELTSAQIQAINDSLTFGTIVNSPLIPLHLNKLMRLQVSKNRGSRNELVEVFKAIGTQVKETVKETKML